MQKIIFNKESREELKNGINLVADAVKVTLGPKGKNVIIDKIDGYPIVTKDGVTVSKSIVSNNLGARLIQEVASKTADIAGDGTTTATVLAQAIISEGLKYLDKGINPIDLKRGIDETLEKFEKYIHDKGIIIDNIEQIKNIATISSNNDEIIGELIANVMLEIGNNGNIIIEESPTNETYTKITSGLSFDRGYVSSWFKTDNIKDKCEFTNASILVCNKKINTIHEVLDILEDVSKKGEPLLIIADDFDNDFITNLVVNKTRGLINVCAVKSTGYGEHKFNVLQDICAVTGAKMALNDEELKNSKLGKAKKIIVYNNETIINEGFGDVEDIEKRKLQIKEQIDSCVVQYDKQLLEERLAKLDGGVAVLYVGAATEVEMKEKKDRVDDAIKATKAAIEEGIVPGGGVTLLRASVDIKPTNVEYLEGFKCVINSFETPLKQICENAGLNFTEIKETILNNRVDFGFGFDANRNKYCNLVDNGIVDAKKVIKTAVKSAISVASMVLLSDCVILNDYKNG